MIAALPLSTSGTDANVQIRGVSPRALEVHRSVRVVEGRFFQPGLPELVVGEATRCSSYAGLELGAAASGSAAPTWTVVGSLRRRRQRASTPRCGATPTC